MADQIPPLPPHSEDAEIAVLGTCLQGDIEAVRLAREILPDPSAFYFDKHRFIWRAILALHDKEIPPDTLTAKDRLEKMGKLEAAGGEVKLAELAGENTVAKNVANYAQMVAETFARRQIINRASQVSEWAFDPSSDLRDMNGLFSDMSPSSLLLPPLKGIGGGNKNLGGWTRLDAKDLRASYEKTQYRVAGVVPEAGVVIFAGPPGIGKTWLSLDMALGVATGGLFLNRFKCLEGRTLLILEEEDPNAVKERLDLLYCGLDMTTAKGDALPIEFLIQAGVSISDSDKLIRLEAHLQDFKPDLLVLDPFRRLHSQDENNSAEMSALFDTLREIARQHNCAVVLVHHLRKSGEFDKGGGLDRLRGSSDIAASVDGVLEVSGTFGDLGVKHAKSKRGPCVETFRVAADISLGAVKLSYYDNETKLEDDRAKARGFVMRILAQGDLNLSGLEKKGREEGYGRKRLQSVVKELEKIGRIETYPEGASKMLRLVPPTPGGEEQQEQASVSVPGGGT